ncbi:MAG: glutathione ABC transporter permease GsiC [Polyangiales bacterium]
MIAAPSGRGWGRRLARAGSAIFGASLTVVGVASLVFLAFRLLPGDPTRLVLGEEAGVEERARLRARLFLDEPLLRQWARFLGRLAHARFGASLQHPERDAGRIVLDALPDTALLAGLAVTFGAVLGLALALVAVGDRRSLVRATADRALGLFASVPLLAFAPAALWLLAVRWRVVPLPADPEAGVRGLLFAAALLAIPLAAAVGRIARASLREAAASPFLQVARAKGRSEAAVWLVHALPTCVGPIVTTVASQLGALLGGAIVLERILERRGLGSVLAEALASRDLPVIEATVVLSTVLFVVAQTLGERIHAAVDPRARG